MHIQFHVSAQQQFMLKSFDNSVIIGLHIDGEVFTKYQVDPKAHIRTAPPIPDADPYLYKRYNLLAPRAVHQQS